MSQLDRAVEFLLASPLLLVPVLLIAATLVYSILKRLLKLAVITAIAGALYFLLLEYFGPGM
ncbi:MAG: hypothetical protein R3304_00580 [Longimicrobiales bacterium]|nr:hypothetical protein [Longimicrobiales bacterium]